MIQRRKYIKRSSKPIRKMGTKRQEQARLYISLRAAFLNATPICQRCGSAESTDVHHKKGRTGANYLDIFTWAALCRTCHEWVHEHRTAARAEGF